MGTALATPRGLVSATQTRQANYHTRRLIASKACEVILTILTVAENRSVNVGLTFSGTSSLNYFNYYSFQVGQGKNFLNISMDIKDMGG